MFISTSVMGQVTRQPLPAINDSIYLSRRTAILIIKDLETGDMYKNLYFNKKSQFDTLSSINSTKDLVIDNLKSTVKAYEIVDKNNQIITNNLSDMLKSNNKQISTQNKILIITIGVIVSIVVLRR